MKVKPVGLLTVGWSHPSGMGIDIPFVKMPITAPKGSDWSYYIPASSFKGALRSASTRIAAPYGFTACGEIKPEGLERGDHLCDVCNLFGTVDKKTPKLYFTDLLPSQHPKGSSLLLTHTRIDYKSQTVAERGLYTREALESSVEFTGSIKYLDPEGLHPLLLLALAELRLGRFGRGSLIDIKLEEVDKLRGEVNSRWAPLLDGLGRWLWLE